MLIVAKQLGLYYISFGQNALLSAVFLKGIDIVDKGGFYSEFEVDLGLVESVFGIEVRAARVRADTVVSVIDINDRLFQGNKLIIVLCLGKLHRRKVRAVKAERLFGRER